MVVMLPKLSSVMDLPCSSHTSLSFPAAAGVIPAASKTVKASM